MEITEISKTFGEKMAELFAAQISDEELIETAKKEWKRLSEKTRGWTGEEDSEISKTIRKAILERLKESVIEYLSQETSKEEIEKQAAELVEKIRETTKQRMIDEVSSRIANLYGTDLAQHLSWIAGSISHLAR